MSNNHCHRVKSKLKQINIIIIIIIMSLKYNRNKNYVSHEIPFEDPYAYFKYHHP